MKSLTMLCCLLLTAAGDAQEKAVNSASFFTEHDQDNDGKLTRSELPPELRRQFRRLDQNEDDAVDLAELQAFRNRGRQSVPEGVTAHRDISFRKTPQKELRLDVYVPDGETSPLPTIVWIHGGAWRAGSKQHCPALPLTKQGFVAVSVSYRLSQDAIFPAQLFDCKAAIRWLRAHAADYKIDPKRIGVWGSSAGGHLVALLGTTGDVPSLEGEGEHQQYSSRVQAVCDFFGPTDFLRMDQDSLPGSPIVHDAVDSPESQLIGGPIQLHPRKAAVANPIRYVSPDDPPFLIIHGKKDPLVPWQQSQLLFDAMRHVGLVQVTFRLVPDAGHSFRGRNGISQLVQEFFARQLAAKPERESHPENRSGKSATND